jgi:hypothetical protein
LWLLPPQQHYPPNGNSNPETLSLSNTEAFGWEVANPNLPPFIDYVLIELGKISLLLSNNKFSFQQVLLFLHSYLLKLTASLFNFTFSQCVVPSIRPRNHKKKIKRAHGYWSQRENRRQFLIGLAKSKGLDPFNASTWKTLTVKDVIAAKGHSLLRVGSYRQVVKDAFPEVTFPSTWKQKGSRPCVFERKAR